MTIYNQNIKILNFRKKTKFEKNEINLFHRKPYFMKIKAFNFFFIYISTHIRAIYKEQVF